jgi:hypothetical protein
MSCSAISALRFIVGHRPDPVQLFALGVRFTAEAGFLAFTAAFFAGAFLRPPFAGAAARASIRAIASSSVSVSVILIQADRIGIKDTNLLWHGALFTGGSGALLGVLAALFRKWLMALPLGQCLAVAGLHGARLLTFLALQALQWHFAVPVIGWQVWVTFLALQMAISRLPLLPAKDLLFAGVAISLGGRLAMTPGVVGGLFVTASGHELVCPCGNVFGGACHWYHPEDFLAECRLKPSSATRDL